MTDYIEIDYTNWRGERRRRNIIPLSIAFYCNQWHPVTQWLLTAFDCDSGMWRTFAMAQIHEWKPKG